MPHHYPDHTYKWSLTAAQLTGVTFDCSYCNTHTAPRFSLLGTLMIEQHETNVRAHLHFCPVCVQPTFITEYGHQVPAVRLGADLKALPEDGIKQLYNEARDCSSVNANTACVMICRKILMNLAVREGAAENLSFVKYVDYLVEKNYVPPKGRAWVDKIRDKGNEANHEIHQMADQDAKEIMHLVEMLLRFNFELGAPAV